MREEIPIIKSISNLNDDVYRTKNEQGFLFHVVIPLVSLLHNFLDESMQLPMNNLKKNE
jgi:hypothetical protein